MNKIFCLLPLCLFLAACAPAEVDTTPVWQQDLPVTGVQMELSNCTLLSEEPVAYTTDRNKGDDWTERPALQTEGVPVVTLYGVEPDQVELRYVENIDYLYLYYDRMMPQIDLDYILTEVDGGLQYRLDTVYNFEFVVTTEAGTDTMIVICSREGLEAKNSR
ncbi:hypothetical protein [uncultured Subdoligranulum sp.]|uniref:hypothetical protein n=1 Tax=uncultured Subdoligranulum sp. TaxID=512298 RepID=UPI0025F8E5AB|nr:hypothetical protein [uncultured Subdoligranulum sp.]